MNAKTKPTSVVRNTVGGGNFFGATINTQATHFIPLSNEETLLMHKIIRIKHHVELLKKESKVDSLDGFIKNVLHCVINDICKLYDLNNPFIGDQISSNTTDTSTTSAEFCKQVKDGLENLKSSLGASVNCKPQVYFLFARMVDVHVVALFNGVYNDDSAHEPDDKENYQPQATSYRYAIR